MPRDFPRFLARQLRTALSDTPAVLLHGPRQSGKSTLARAVGLRRGYHYLTFDDDVLRASAREDPVGFVGGLPTRVIIDEVQRVPELFTSLKLAIDRRRTPGRFLLTGSANLLLVPTLADSLAGRLEILQLHPLSQAEILGRAPTFLDRLWAAEFPTRTVERLGDALAARVADGGYPAAIRLRSPARRAAWLRNHVETQVQRDARDLRRLQSLDVLPRLLALAASQTARLINVSELAGPFQLTRQTMHEYVTVLERIFLLERLPSWHSNRLSRLVKAPKLHITDTGLACAILGLDARALADDRSTLGPLLETFVLQELRRQASWRELPTSFFHFRDRDGMEVDIVMEQGAGRVAGIEVKSSSTVRSEDFNALRKLRDAAGAHFKCGVVLHDGESSASFGDRLFAVPLRAMWEAW